MMLELRYVVLWHELPAGSLLEGQARQSHFDLMFQVDEFLLTWECASWPPVERGDHPVRSLAPHRLAYLDYEGPVSNNRGFVQRVDAGQHAIINRNADSLRTRVHGEQFVGLLELTSDRLRVLESCDDQRH